MLKVGSDRSTMDGTFNRRQTPTRTFLEKSAKKKRTGLLHGDVPHPPVEMLPDNVVAASFR